MPGEPKLDDQIRNTTKNVAILLAKVHNLQVEVKEMQTQQKTLIALFVRLLPPDLSAELEAQIKEYQTQKNNPR